MAINFPGSPTLNDQYISGGITYTWDGSKWTSQATPAPGYTGSQGVIGYTGSQGITGYTGSQGIQGVIGYTGSQGVIGYTGSASTVVGYTGSLGPIGYTGSASTVVGYTGSQGTQGVIGYTGSASTVIGYTGSAGVSTPAGSTTQIQYNNAGVMGASANLTYDSANNRLSLTGTDPEIVMGGITTEPGSPSAGQMYVYAKSIGGRMMLKQKGPSGLDTPFQSAIAQNKIGFWNPPGNSTTVPGVFGFQAFSSISSGSSASSRNVASTDMLTRSRRIGYNSGGATNNYSGIFHPAAQWTVGTGSGLGGFYYIVRWGSTQTGTGYAFFIGLGTSTSTQSDGTGIDPTTQTNQIGVGAATGDTNYQIVYGGSAAQTKINLGSGFPKSSASSLYELILYAPPSLNNTVYYRVSNLSTAVETSGTLTGTAGTALPSSTTFLTPRIWKHTGSSSTSGQLDIVNIYIETDQ